MRKSFFIHSLIAVAMGASALGVRADEVDDADGTWANAAGGVWSDVDIGNWQNDTVASGAGFTADFSKLDITAETTVSLGAPRTIGNLIFDDIDLSTVGRWILDNGGSASNILTLAGDTPTITVNDMGVGSSTTPNILMLGTATISAVIAGENGLVKDGNGTTATGGGSIARGILVLAGANTYSGGTTISAGTLAVQHASALGTGAVTVANGGQLQVRGVTIANTININGGNALHSTSPSGSNLSGIVNLQSNSGIKLASNTGNATLTLSGTLNLNGYTLTVQTINVDPAVTISGVISGDGMITKVSDGTLRITGDNTDTFTGTVRLQRGHIAVGNDNAFGSGTLNFHVDNDATGTIKSTDGTTRTIANPITVTGGNGKSHVLFGLTTNGQTGHLIFTGNVLLSTPAGGGPRSFQFRTRTQFDGDISGEPGITMVNNSATLNGAMVLNGHNTYKGDTTVEAGTLELGQTGTMTFYVGANGVNNRILGTGTALLDGAFAFDLSAADRTFGNVWNIVDVDNLTETFGPTFHVAKFTDFGGNLWRYDAGSATYFQFDTSSGNLTFVPEPSSMSLLGLAGVALLKRRRRS